MEIERKKESDIEKSAQKTGNGKKNNVVGDGKQRLTTTNNNEHGYIFV